MTHVIQAQLMEALLVTCYILVCSPNRHELLLMENIPISMCDLLGMLLIAPGCSSSIP